MSSNIEGKVVVITGASVVLVQGASIASSL